MEKTFRIKWWWMAVIAIAILVFLLNFPGMAGVRPARAQSAGTSPLAPSFSWEYQLDFNAASLPDAQGQAASLTPGLANQGVASELQPLGDSMYRLSMTGNQGMEQVRQVLYSTRLAGFIGGAAEVQVTMPVGSLLDTPFKLDSNLTTGYSWEVNSSRSIDFAQAGESTYVTRSHGYGAPSVQTLVLRPGNVGNGVVDLVYRRPFAPDEAITRHLRITLDAQALGIDLTDPHPEILSSPVSPAASPSAKNPIDQIPVKGVLPASWDWRTAGIMPVPRDQGGCGSCWAFGTVGVMESAILKAGGPMTDLSEQFLVSCNTSGWGCNGGLTAHMWHYDTLAISQAAIGAVLEADKPYTATNGTCTVAYNHPYKLSGWQFITATEFTMPTVDQIKNAIVTYGPITAGVCADGGWNSYTGGVYNPASNACGGSTNHQIILVGWDDATSSWILRNSWGPSWGESGYMRISWDTTGTTSRVGEGTSWVTWDFSGPAPFGKISPANASIGQPGNPVLSWGTSSGAASYSYCVDTSNNNTCDTSWISTATVTSVPLSGLATGIHYWQVRATNPSGTTEANAGTWWSFTVGKIQQYYWPLVLWDFPGLASGIVNGNFESGTSGWTEYSTHGWPIIMTSFSGGVTARSGSYAAWLGGEFDDVSYVQQQVAISPSAPYLVYWHWIASEDICGFDFGGVVVNGTVVQVYDLCSSTSTGGWVSHSVNLSAYAGQSVMLQIRAETDYSLNSNLFVDDISLAASAAAPGPSLPVVPNSGDASTRGKSGILGPVGLPQGLPAQRLFSPR